MDNNEWVCCNCGVVTLDEHGRCQNCHSDNVVPADHPESSQPSGIDQHWADEAEHNVRVLSPKGTQERPGHGKRAG